jgi:hypothetical protein
VGYWQARESGRFVVIAVGLIELVLVMPQWLRLSQNWACGFVAGSVWGHGGGRSIERRWAGADCQSGRFVALLAVLLRGKVNFLLS